MTFKKSYDYLISLSNLPRKEYMADPRKCSWYLKRLQFFLDILCNPEKQIPHYIHVTGTSGKGSVTSLLHSILHASGKKVGSTYSPHPTCITERWKIGNKYMSKKEFVELIEFIKPKLDEYARTTPYDALSFFEITEAIGFLYFVQKKVDWAVLEVACGGRYDASNVIPHKDIAVITNIGLDHVGIIGNNKEEIAYEKAGIIQSGCKVFTMEKDKKILNIIEDECKKQSAISYKQIKQNKLQVVSCKLQETKFKYKNNEYILPTLGTHQINNAILCIEIAKSLNIPESKIKQGLKNVKQPLRMEIVSQNPMIILDGAHNPDKIKTTVTTLQHLSTSAPKHKNNIHLIVGFSHNKDVNKMLTQLATLKPKTVAITRYTNNPFRKTADVQKIYNKLKKLLPKTKLEIFLDPKDALDYNMKKNKKNDIILCTGSIFLSGELRQYLT